MQLVARLMDHVLHQRSERTTIVVATSGDTGGAAVEAFRSRAQSDVVVLFPQDRISDVQRRMMTTVPDLNVHALAIQRDVRRSPSACEGDVQSSCVPRSCAPLRCQFHQMGAHRRPQMGTHMIFGRSRIGGASPKDSFYRADREFWRRLCRLCRFANGIADPSSGGGDRTLMNICPPDLRYRHLRNARRHCDNVAVNGHSGVFQLRTSLVRCLWTQMRSAVRNLTGVAGAVSPASRCQRKALKELRAMFTADRADEQESAASHPRLDARGRLLRRSAHRGRARRGGEGNARPGDADGGAVNRASGKVPRCGQGRLRHCAGIPRLACRPADERPERVTVLPADQAAVENVSYRRRRVRRVKEQRHDALKSRVLPSGLSVVTDRMPHLRIGLARRLDRLRQPRRKAGRTRHFASARTHGVQGHQAAHRAPDRRSNRGGRRRSQCRDQRGNRPAYFARVLEGRRAAGARRAVRHPVRADLRSGGVAARAERYRAGNRRHRRRARRPGVRPLAGNRVSRTADRPLHPRHAGHRALVQRRRACAPISSRNYRAPRHAGRRCRRRRSRRRSWPKPRSALPASTGRPRRRRSRRISAAAPGRDPRSRAGAYRAGAARPAGARSDRSTACRFSPACSAAACRRGCSRKCAKTAASATRSMHSTCLIPTPACSASMPAPTKPTRPN